MLTIQRLDPHLANTDGTIRKTRSWTNRLLSADRLGHRSPASFGVRRQGEGDVRADEAGTG